MDQGTNVSMEDSASAGDGRKGCLAVKKQFDTIRKS
jgi:hypothetical protein